MLVQKNFDPKKLIQKEILVENFFFGPKINFSPQMIFGRKKHFFGPKKCFDQKKSFGQKNFWSKKTLDLKLLWMDQRYPELKILSFFNKKFFKLKILLGTDICFLEQKMFGPKIFFNI